ncbi:MAG: sigma-70 family RNA polymerase sigma factor [Fimbriimonadaceae bacterium]|nr:sigma-70 family RNA polymerase sigma factor [Fimbriimonadaceae bacterium]
MNGAERLLEAVGRGDGEAWSQLLERYRPFVLGRLRQAAAARNWFWLDDLDDATQEVLVRFYEAVRSGRFRYRDEDQLRGFLVRTAFFVAMQRKDAAAGERPVSDLPAEDQEELTRRFDLAAFAASAFDTLGRRQCLQELYAAIDRLSPARREVLRLSLLGLRPREIAPRLARSANAVSVLKFHALEDLRRELEASDFMVNCGRYFCGAEEAT